MEWLGDCIKAYEIEDEEELEKQEWFQVLWDSVKQELAQAEALFTQGISVCQEPGGPCLYEEALQSDMLLIDELQLLCEKQDLTGCVVAFCSEICAPFCEKSRRCRRIQKGAGKKSFGRKGKGF